MEVVRLIFTFLAGMLLVFSFAWLVQNAPTSREEAEWPNA